MGPTRGHLRTSSGAAARTVGRRRRALVALALATLAGATLAATAPLPDAVVHEMQPLPAPRGPLGPTWSALASLIPAPEPTRWAVLATALSLGMAGATGWLGFQLFRGPGRIMAAFTAAMLSSTALASWVRSDVLTSQVPSLAFGILALLAVTALVRPLVHLGRVTPVAFARALAAAASSAVVLPSGGLPLLVFCAATYLLRGRRITDLRGAPANASLSRATMSGNATVIAAAALVVPVAAGVVLWAGHDGPSPWAWILDLRLAAPPLDALRAHLHPYSIYPALTLVLLLVLPLRWRGGITLLTLFATALVVADDSGPLATLPVLACGVSVAASGWVWLAGSVTRRPNAGRALALVAATGLLVLALPQRWTHEPAARMRPAVDLTRLVIAGATQPGDVLVAHEPALVREWQAWRAREGTRPDLTLVAAAELTPTELAARIDAARSGGPRLLSDAYQLQGPAGPEDAIEVGPLYWFAFDPSLAEGRDRVDLVEPSPSVVGPTRARWTRLQLERARFRRATGNDADAVLALPLGDRRRSLRTAIRVSQAINLAAPPSSELGRVGEVEDFPPRAPVLAETGDVLFRAGEHALGLAMLTESARSGYPPAWRALARWQLEVGRAEAAEELRDLMAVDPELREPFVDVVWWLLWKGRRAEAMAWRDRLDERPVGDPSAEIAVRLAILSAASTARPPGP
jgi:hypothetical protein